MTEEQKVNSRVDFSLPEKLDCHLADRRKTAFTLAEVLITLGIIGIVAAMTMPVILNKIDDRANINKLRREYSLFQQAFQQIAAENDLEFKNGISHCAGLSGVERNTCLKDVFKPKLKIIADCDTNSGTNLSKCFVPQAETKQLNGKPAGYYYFNGNLTSGLLLEDGSSVAIHLDSADCNILLNRCGFIVIDVNGPKRKPNTWGKDLFLFFVFSNKIVPADGNNIDNGCYGQDDECEGYKDNCGTGSNYGTTCASKYLYK
ncbi:type II secretion system protein [bacterium]|nr:type II secretion system protein [bacterium]